MNSESLAVELLHELKVSSKRWFIAFITMLVVEILTIMGFLWYISLPIEESSNSITQESNQSSYNQIVGGDYGGETDG